MLTNTEIWTLYLATSSFKEWDGTTIIKTIKAACVLQLTKGTLHGWNPEEEKSDTKVEVAILKSPEINHE